MARYPLGRAGLPGRNFGLDSRPLILHILEMQNMSNLNPDQVRFIDDLSALLTAWSMPANAARLYGYLQLMNDPVGLDDIARDLEISKSNACTAAKVLETHGNARRVTERGTKRVLYVAGDDPGAPLRKQAETLGRMARLIAARKSVVATGAAEQRLARLSAFHGDLQCAMEAVILPRDRRGAA
jgi:DNA-binding transcriptional regulator GbsR (MarR family)